MKKKFVSIAIFIIIIFLIVVVIYKSYTPNTEKQKTVAESTETSVITTSLPETTVETTAVETLSTPSIIETTTEDISKNLPTLRIIVYEGPVIVQDSDICYYRVEAVVTGDPYPNIKFSKDDSNGTWGNNKAQVNLKNGESYDLIVTATNSVGKVTKHIFLTWSQ